MSAKQYLENISRAAGVPQSAARLSDVLGDAAGTSSLSRFLTKAKADAPPDVEDGLGTVVGAAAGAYLGYHRGHPWLGAIGGASLGRNLPALLHPSERKIALVNMGETAAAVGMSLMSPAHPVVGFIVGRLAAGAVVYFGKLR